MGADQSSLKGQSPSMMSESNKSPNLQTVAKNVHDHFMSNDLNVSYPIDLAEDCSNRSTLSHEISTESSKSHFNSSSLAHKIVVVQEKTGPIETLETDPDYIKLQFIPSFSPIIPETLSSHKVQDPAILSKFDYHLLLDLCLKYQEYLRIKAELVAEHQNNLTSQIKEVDISIVSMRNKLMEKLKKFSECCQRHNQINDIFNTINKCEISLINICDKMDSLNELLPDSEKLEPLIY